MSIRQQILIFLPLILGLATIAFGLASKPERSKREVETVQKTSELLAALEKLNNQYAFDATVKEEYTISAEVSSKSKAEHYNLLNILDREIQKSPYLLQMAQAVARNKADYAEYQRRVSSLRTTATREFTEKLGVPHAKYMEIENNLFQKRQLKSPITESKIIFMAIYSAPWEKRKYIKRGRADIDIVPLRVSELKKAAEYQKSEAARRKRERTLMTDKLRYSILKRDGFRCRICGRTAADGVKLHVDHIIPVSKGGKTVPNNLRTLCETCNWGKSDEIE